MRSGSSSSYFMQTTRTPSTRSPPFDQVLVHTARTATNLTYSDTALYLTSQLRAALKSIAVDLIIHLVDDDRANIHLPVDHPGGAKYEAVANTGDLEASELVEQFGPFAFDLGRSELGAGACDNLSDNVVRMLLVGAWEKLRDLKQRPTVAEG
ncbi:hypothetical protein LTR56_020778 [Elasticomyces elasticus]|nr:hypothetical protein LTR56_020778 [Elasticomyces elasticus]KAK3659304.1 hypothetical protein LTR22_008571 [Elasticomyces elasticus]KAK4925794.1 hypothetical protein LTR49_007170 [Elasticomyces elasticus]